MNQKTRRKTDEARWADIISSLDEEIQKLFDDPDYGFRGCFRVHHLMKARRHYTEILVKSIKEGASRNDTVQSNRA